MSQLVNSFVMLYIAFVLGPQHWPMGQFLAVGTVNYAYKLALAVLMIRLIYAARRGIQRYLGAEAAERLRRGAAQ